jgi:hypothetical protein
MDNTFSQFLAAYSTATPEMKQLIDSEEIGIFVDTLLIGETTTNIKPKLLVIITNRLLAITDETVIKSQVLDLNLKDPEVLTKIQAFINSKKTFTSSSSLTPSEITSEIAETEAALSRISAIRTMARDGQQVGYANAAPEATYTSHQSAILNEGK